MLVKRRTSAISQVLVRESYKTASRLYLEAEHLMVSGADLLHQLKPRRLPMTFAAHLVKHRHWVFTCTHTHTLSETLLQEF